ncbi:hypothetical protein [Prosthecobacter sp.]|uniref:hypothetical protein n=1 Tax=Prosthecobacter sp. TaxID=1965333 RepID=UPI003782D4CE
MKIKALIPTLALVLFAGMASAQSDPSVGGSFGTAYKENSGTVAQRQPLSTTDSTTSTPAHTSFWGRLMGKKSSAMQADSTTPVRSHNWFHRQTTPNNKPASTHRWLGMKHSSSSSMQGTAPMSSRSKMMNNNTAATKPRGWHIPFFSSRQPAHS